MLTSCEHSFSPAWKRLFPVVCKSSLLSKSSVSSQPLLLGQGQLGQQAAATVKAMATGPEGVRLALLQEAALHLAGSCAYHVAEHLNFEAW